MKRMVIIALAVSLFLTALCTGAYAATNEASNYSNAVQTRSELVSRFQEIKNRYVGTYWTTNGSPNSNYTASKYYYGWQCKGFGNYVFNELFKTGNIGAYNETYKYYINSPNCATLISQATNVGASDTATVKSFLSGVMMGDMIQVKRRNSSNGHTMIVESISDTGVTILDCNSDGKCGVQSYVQSWSTFASKNISMSLYRSTVYPPEETCNCSDSHAGNYTCMTSTMDLMIRSGHGSSYSAVGSVPPGANVYVSKANGTWAHVEYNGITGYCSMEYLQKIEPVYRGSEMAYGYDRTLLDGDYIIATAGSSDKSRFLYLDILGTDYPSDNGISVGICGPSVGDDIPAYDVWSIRYADGFYSIQQKGSNMYLDVTGDQTAECCNITAWTDNGGYPCQKWAISHNDDNGGADGYRIQAKCSGLCLDVSGGLFENGNKVWQYRKNGTVAQSWLFIPYKPAQPIEEGRYILHSGMDWNMVLDVEGDYQEGQIHDVAQKLNVQIWNASEQPIPDRFDITKLPNGYYKFRHVATGKCLDVTGGVSNYGSNVALYSDNGNLSQQWAIIPNGDGYEIVSRCSGLVLYVAGDYATTGTNVAQRPRLNDQWGHEKWYFTPAEYNVSYNANGGKDAPKVQRKIYRSNLVLSNVIPTFAGKQFKGWSVSADAKKADYQPSDYYTEDADITLYAVWAGPDFILPSALKEIDEEAFAGTKFCFVALPEATTLIKARAFTDCPNMKYIHIPNDETIIAKDAFEGVANLTIFGKDGSYAQYFANKYGYKFIEY